MARATTAEVREVAIRAIDAPPEWDERWPDDRVTCGPCVHREGAMCYRLRTSHVPLDVKHRCEDFRKRSGK